MFVTNNVLLMMLSWWFMFCKDAKVYLSWLWNVPIFLSASVSNCAEGIGKELVCLFSAYWTLCYAAVLQVFLHCSYFVSSSGIESSIHLNVKRFLTPFFTNSASWGRVEFLFPFFTLWVPTNCLVTASMWQNIVFQHDRYY